LNERNVGGCVPKQSHFDIQCIANVYPNGFAMSNKMALLWHKTIRFIHFKAVPVAQTLENGTRDRKIVDSTLSEHPN